MENNCEFCGGSGIIGYLENDEWITEDCPNCRDIRREFKGGVDSGNRNDKGGDTC